MTSNDTDCDTSSSPPSVITYALDVRDLVRAFTTTHRRPGALAGWDEHACARLIQSGELRPLACTDGYAPVFLLPLTDLLRADNGEPALVAVAIADPATDEDKALCRDLVAAFGAEPLVDPPA